MKKLFLTLALFLGFAFSNSVLANESLDTNLTTSFVENVVEGDFIAQDIITSYSFEYNNGVLCTLVTRRIRLYDNYFRGIYLNTVYQEFTYWSYCPGSGPN